MKKNGVLISLVLSFLLVFSIAHAERTVWYVHPDSALNTIQAGLDACTDNDIVLVGPGIYVENIIWPNTQGIHLISELGADYTIIDGDSAGSVIICLTGVDTTTIIRDFTIQNGHTSQGAGIRCGTNSSPTITGNTITNNSARVGGGIYCLSASPIIANNIITGNAAWSVSAQTVPSGGGIYCNASSPTITDNTIMGNNTGGSLAATGGGITCSYSSPIIINNRITDNTAYGAWWSSGGGVYCLESSPTLKHNTIMNNTAIWGGGITCKNNSSPTFKHNTIMNNSSWIRGGGILCDDSSSPTIDSCTIANNNPDGVYSGDYSEPEIHYCNIYNNSGYGVRNVDSTLIVDATYNWWGDPSGPSGFGPGTGDSVSQWVDYDPWLQDSVQWVGIEEYEHIQHVATVLQISPNPSRDKVDIRWQITENIERNLIIYNATGRLIKEFHITDHSFNRVTWDGRDNSGKKVPCGIYFLKFQAGSYIETKKIVLFR